MIIKNTQSKEVVNCDTIGEAISLLMQEWSDSELEAEDFLNNIEITELSTEEETYIRNEFAELAEENSI